MMIHQIKLFNMVLYYDHTPHPLTQTLTGLCFQHPFTEDTVPLFLPGRAFMCGCSCSLVRPEYVEVEAMSGWEISPQLPTALET